MEDLVLANLDTARQALIKAKTIQETKVIMDMAIAAEVYAKRQELGEEAIRYAQEIKIEALRQLGNMLKETKRNRGETGQFTGSSKVVPPAPPTLADLGLNKKISSLAQQVADLSDEEIEKVKEGVTLASIIKENKRTKIKENARKVNPPEGKYRIIYADPPWSYSNTMPSYFIEQADHYPLMTIEEICSLSIEKIAEDNSVLFLWATSPILEDAFKVINSWGFKYKASFIWDKIEHNLGHYNSVRHEFLLIATRGSCLPDNNKLFDSVVSIKRTEHSKKPEEFRKIIETLYTWGNKIELFARRKVDGWDNYGNEI